MSKGVRTMKGTLAYTLAEAIDRYLELCDKEDDGMSLTPREREERDMCDRLIGRCLRKAFKEERA